MYDFVARFYLSKKESSKFNAIFVDCKKRHYKTKLKKAVRLYFVVEGSGTFSIDNKVHNAKPYDFFVIRDQQVYEYKGKMKLIEVNIPATDKSNEIQCE